MTGRAGGDAASGAKGQPRPEPRVATKAVERDDALARLARVAAILRAESEARAQGAAEERERLRGLMDAAHYATDAPDDEEAWWCPGCRMPWDDCLARGWMALLADPGPGGAPR